MTTQFNILQVTRDNYLKAIDGLTLEQFNTIPEGFNNNIIWNLTHIVVTQQLLCYGLTSNRIRLSEDIITDYRKGSKPKRPVTQEEVNQTIAWLTDSIGWIKEDYSMGIFKEYKRYPTSYGFVVSSIEDAITFNNIHESMHLGWVGAIKKHL